MVTNNFQKRILFTGGSSLLAFLWAKARAETNDILLIEHEKKIPYSFWPVAKLKLDDPRKLADFFNEQQVDTVVHTAALTNVELCEKQPDLADLVNAKISGLVAKACRLADVQMIHISTDHFYGLEQDCFSEEHQPILMNTYAISKFKGEQLVMEQYEAALVCRTNFYGYGPAHKFSFSDKIIASLRNQIPITLFEDVFFTPLIGAKLAEYAHELIDKGFSGIFNICSNDIITKYSFGQAISQQLDLPSRFVIPCSINDKKDLVCRPTAMALSNQKATNALGHSLDTIADHLKLL